MRACKIILPLFTFLASLFLSNGLVAAPIFNITTTQKTITLPINTSGTLTYTITNNTRATLNKIKYTAPPLTTIDSSGSTCGVSLNSNASCTLNLTVRAPSTPGTVLLGALQVCSRKSSCSVPNTDNRTTLIITEEPTGDFYVLNYDGNTVSLLDSNTNVITKTITVGNAPRAIVFNSTGTRAYVANQSSNSISVIDTTSNTVISTITGITNPRKLVIMPDDSKIYVQQDSKTGNIQVVNLTTEPATVSSISVTNGSVDIALRPNGTTLYSLGNVTTALPASLPLFLIDTSTDTVTSSVTLVSGQVALSTYLTRARIACSPDGTFLVLSGGAYGNNTFTQSTLFVNLNTNVVTTKTPALTGIGANPGGEASIAITSDSQKTLSGTLYTSGSFFSSKKSNRLQLGVFTCTPRNRVYDVLAGSFIGSANVCDYANVISTVVNAPLNTKFYTPQGNTDSNQHPNGIGIVSASTGNNIGTLTLGAFNLALNYMVFTTDGLHAYVTNRGANVIYFVDTAADTLTSTISTNVGPGPSMIARKPI